MTTSRLWHNALLLATIILTIPFSAPTNAADCKCGKVQINKLLLSTLEYNGWDPPTRDVYQLAGKSFELVDQFNGTSTPPGGVGVYYESEEDFSMEVQEAVAFQIVMGMNPPERGQARGRSQTPNFVTTPTLRQNAEISFSCGVEKVKVNDYTLSIVDKDRDVAPSLRTNGSEDVIALERQGCGAVLKINLLESGGATLTITPYKSEGSASCSGDEQSEEPSSAPGPDPSSPTSSFNASFSSGLVNGVSNGLITWNANNAADAVTLDSLSLPGVADDPEDNFLLPGTEYYRDGNRLQYKTGTQLFDAQTNDEVLTLRFYDTSSLGSLSNGFYNPTAGLFKTITYTNAGDSIGIEKSEGGNPVPTHALEWSTTGNTATSSWTDLANSRKLVTIRTPNNDNRVVTNEEWNVENPSAPILLSRTSREYQPKTSGGFLLYQTIEDPTWPGHANAANVTETLYYDSNDKLARRVGSDGSWNIYTIGNDSNFTMDEDALSQSVTYSPWLDSTIPQQAGDLPSLANCVARVTREEIDEYSSSVFTITETYTGGVLSAMELQTKITNGGFDVDVSVQFPGNDLGLISETWTYPPSSSFTGGRLYRTSDPSGRSTTYSYQKMSYDTNDGYIQDNDGTLTGTYATEEVCGCGALDNDGNSLTARTFTVTDEEGRTLHTETQAYIGSGNYETMTVTDYSRFFDLNGRLLSTNVTRDGRMISSETNLSGTETANMNEYGFLELQTTDSHGRALSEVRGGVTTTYTYSPLTTTITRSASDLPTTTVTTVTNLLGETVSSTDEFGTVTTYSHDHTNRTDTETRNGISIIHARYCDGRDKSTTGNGVVPSYIIYQIAENTGYITTTTSSGPSNADRWQSTTSDWAGRTISTSRPGPPNGNNRYPAIVTSYYYDSVTKAQYKTSVSTGQAPTLTLSDALGFTTSSGLDVNDDDELDAANGDRFTTSRTYYAKAPAPDNQWWQTTDTTSWITPTQSQTTRTSNLMNAADGETQKTTRNLGTACESTTTITRTFNPGNHVITTTTTGPAGTYSSTDTTDSTGNRIVQTAVPDITNPANPQTSALEINQYDAYGRPILHTDPRGATTLSFHYSGTNQLERVTDQLDNSTHYTYYPSNDPHAGMVATVTDNGGGTTTTTYNSRGQTEEITGNAAYHQAFVYDDYGDQYSLTTYGTVTATTIWHHDGPTGLLTFKEYQGGSGTHYTYTADGKICTRLWQRGVTTTYSYNSATGDLTNVAYSGTNDTTPSVTFSNHDLLGRPHTVVESRPVIINNNPTIINDTTTLSYDLVTGAESTTYDSGHSLLPDLSLTAKAPDANGFPPGYNLNNGSNPVHDWTYTNDAFGRVVSLASGGFTVEFSPQPGTRRVREQTTKLNTTTIHQSTRGIDMLGRVTGMVSRAPDFSVSGHPVRIIASAGHHYDARSRRKDTRREDGTLWQYGYDDRSEVTSAVKTTANSQLVPGQSFGYVFDGMGNRVTSTAGTGSNVAETSYGRNALNRYTSITTPGVADILARSDSQQGISFTVDENPVTPTNIGNLYNAHATVANSPDGKYSSISITSGSTTKTGHRWTAPTSVTPQYDDDGNLKQDGRWIYDWDAENRLVRMTTLGTASATSVGAPDLTIEYSYDWRSRNIGRKVTGGSNPSDERIIYDGWNPVAEFSVSSVQLVNKKTLLWGPDLSGTLQGAGGVGGLVMVSDRRTTTVAHYIPSYNTNGDIIAWSDPTGQLIRRMDYDPFGNLILCENFSGDSADLDKFLTHGFSTKPADPDTGLLYYGYRWLGPVTGRWLSVDPIGERGGANLYGFVRNNGVSNKDVAGLKIATECPITEQLQKRGVKCTPHLSEDGLYLYSDVALSYDSEILRTMIAYEHTFVFKGRSSDECWKLMEEHGKARQKVMANAIKLTGLGWGESDGLFWGGHPLDDPGAFKMMCFDAEELANQGQNRDWVRSSIFIPGDAGYIANRNHALYQEGPLDFLWKNRNVGEEGENIIYLGNGVFFGQNSKAPEDKIRPLWSWLADISSWHGWLGTPVLLDRRHVVITGVSEFRKVPGLIPTGSMVGNNPFRNGDYNNQIPLRWPDGVGN